jgi:hypothetical protein
MNETVAASCGIDTLKYIIQDSHSGNYENYYLP